MLYDLINIIYFFTIKIGNIKVSSGKCVRD